MSVIPRERKLEVLARRFYLELMGEDFEFFPWDDENTPSNETVREAQDWAQIALAVLEDLEGTLPESRPPLPVSVRRILKGTLTPGGMDMWWTNYLRLDPHAQEGHAREHARTFVATLRM